jgi:hypothetical protein
MTPKEVSQAADKAGRVPAGREVTRLTVPAATKIRPEAAAVVRARLGAGIRVELADLTPALAASLRHAASMHNPQFYEKQRMRASTWDIPRFLQFFDETTTWAGSCARMRTRPRPKSTTTSMNGLASSPPCSPNAPPATPVGFPDPRRLALTPSARMDSHDPISAQEPGGVRRVNPG